MYSYPGYLGTGARRVLMLAAAMVGMAGLAACAGGGAQPPPDSGHPAQAIVSAVQHTEAVRSLTARISELASNANADQATIATIQEQIKPTLLLSMRINIPIGGNPSTTVVLTPTAYYVTAPSQAVGRGKHWGTFAVHPYGGLTEMAQVFQSQANDPLAQIMLLRVVEGARYAGSQAVGGVPTAHYTGYYLPSKAVAAMPVLNSQLELTKSKVEISIWIDAAQRIRKLSEVQSVGGPTVTTTLVFSDVNQPVHITVPPASQVAKLPAGG